MPKPLEQLDKHDLRSVYDQHQLTLTVALGSFHTEHLKRLFEIFDGDLMLPLILGEIGHFNLRGLDLSKISTTEELIAFASQMEDRALCNAHSVSLSLGIPWETVRRKVFKLIKLGYLDRGPRNGLKVTQHTVDTFGPNFNYDSFRNLVSTYRQVSHLTRKAAT